MKYLLTPLTELSAVVKTDKCYQMITSNIFEAIMQYFYGGCKIEFRVKETETGCTVEYILTGDRIPEIRKAMESYTGSNLNISGLTDSYNEIVAFSDINLFKHGIKKFEKQEALSSKKEAVYD